jgi:glucosamine--fructose-6-phosphate aminotransferase (isomerizing)
MLAETLEAPAAAARMLAADADRLRETVDALRADPPRALLTLARGSSDHAAAHFAYLAMARLGLLAASLPPSLLTLHPPRLAAQGLLAVAFSQSGRSPDLVQSLQQLRAGGARTLAFVNEPGSPLAGAAERSFGLHAGPERSVAATKSVVAQLVAGARLVAAWEGDLTLQAAVHALPELLAEALAVDWSAALPVLVSARQLYVVGRGTGLPAAHEIALKLKETCALHAEAYSGAELRHGPMALVQPGFPVLLLAPHGPAHEGLLALASELRARRATVLLAAPAGTPGATLPLPATAHEALGAIPAVLAAYPLAEALARARGLDPDAPRHLSKVTLTL